MFSEIVNERSEINSNYKIRVYPSFNMAHVLELFNNIIILTLQYVECRVTKLACWMFQIELFFPATFISMLDKLFFCSIHFVERKCFCAVWLSLIFYIRWNCLWYLFTLPTLNLHRKLLWCVCNGYNLLRDYSICETVTSGEWFFPRPPTPYWESGCFVSITFNIFSFNNP